MFLKTESMMMMMVVKTMGKMTVSNTRSTITIHLFFSTRQFNEEKIQIDELFIRKYEGWWKSKPRGISYQLKRLSSAYYPLKGRR